MGQFHIKSRPQTKLPGSYEINVFAKYKVKLRTHSDEII